MGMFKIYVNKFREINFDRLNLLANYIAKENNKSVSYVKFDMIRNFLKYKIGYTDYFKGDYINLTNEKKKDFLTSKNYISVIGYLNPRPYRVVMNDKLVFNQIYSKYLGRSYIDIRRSDVSDIKAFLKDKKNVFLKPTTSFGGQNILKVVVSEIDDIESFRTNAIKNGQYLLEEEIKQHDYVNKINPNAVNTFRIITLYKDGVAHVLANSFRISLDLNPAIQCRDSYMRLSEDGKPLCKFIDDDGVIYDKHPLTGFDFNSIDKIPFVKEAYSMVKEAALLVPEVRYVGWDVAITNEGPCIIEGNEFPSYGLIQNYLLNKENPGHLKQIKDVIGDEIKNIKL